MRGEKSDDEACELLLLTLGAESGGDARCFLAAGSAAAGTAVGTGVFADDDEEEEEE